MHYGGVMKWKCPGAKTPRPKFEPSKENTLMKTATSIQKASPLLRLAALAFAVGISPASHAYSVAWNEDIYNTIGLTADDLHVTVSAAQDIQIDSTFNGYNAGPQFNPPAIAGNGTNTLDVTWAGATVHPAQMVHVGLAMSGADSVVFSNPTWTSSGNAIANFPIVNVSFDGQDGWKAIWIDIWDASGALIAVEHMVGRSTLGSMRLSSGSGVPLDITYGIQDLLLPIPLDNLNPVDQNPADYGSFTATRVFPAPEPGLLPLLGIAFAGMKLLTRRQGLAQHGS